MLRPPRDSRRRLWALATAVRRRSLVAFRGPRREPRNRNGPGEFLRNRREGRCLHIPMELRGCPRGTTVLRSKHRVACPAYAKTRFFGCSLRKKDSFPESVRTLAGL